MTNTIDRLRAGRAAKAVEALVQRELAQQAEFEAIDEAVEKAYANYDRALKKATAVAHDDSTLWRAANAAQNRAISLSQRQRVLAQLMEDA